MKIKWEYKVCCVDEDAITEKWIAPLGSDGWELVSDAQLTSVRRRLIFKRQVAQSAIVQ